jgi:hypothetical protein
VPAPITPQQRQQIVTLHKQGLSRNAIAREANVSPSTVTKVCTEDGLTFDRSKTINATQAKVADNKARRAAITERLYKRAEAILDRLEAPTYMVRMMGPMGSEKVHDEAPPAGDERNLATSIAVYLDKATKLEDYDRTGDESGAAVDKWLAHMMGADYGS